MQSGFWKYSRHPNYFFQWIACGFLPVRSGRRRMVDFLLPLLMLFLLVRSLAYLQTKSTTLNPKVKHTKYQQTTSSLSLSPAAQKPHDRYTVRRIGCLFPHSKSIRRLNRRLKSEAQARKRIRPNWLKSSSSPIAIETIAANDQHYEVPPEFFERCLDKHLKYSCCYWPNEVSNLDQAESSMLRLTCERAELKDGQTILELGCGWGAISLWMASTTQTQDSFCIKFKRPKKIHRKDSTQRGFQNLQVQTCDMNSFRNGPNF